MQPLWIHVGGWPQASGPQAATPATALDFAAARAALDVEQPLAPSASTVAARRAARPVCAATTRAARPAGVTAGTSAH